jgi:NAD(P)-dependent dehydrogenase (short-subunit alcohol dehydrogenase family)
LQGDRTGLGAVATQALLPGMRERQWGRIVNISSLTVVGITHRTGIALSAKSWLPGLSSRSGANGLEKSDGLATVLPMINPATP